MKNYELLIKQAEELINSEINIISLLSNSSAFVYQEIDRLNWVGYYLVTDNLLTVGPFQGKVACSVIEYGKGVCGSSWESKEPIVVDDVTTHENHIFCDPNSKSEMVIPIIKDNQVIAVFDLDSPEFNRFDENLQQFLLNFVNIVTNRIIELSYWQISINYIQ